MRWLALSIAFLLTETTLAAPAHPFLLFNSADVPALRQRANADPLLATCLAAIRSNATSHATNESAVAWAEQLEAQAFLATLDADSNRMAQSIDRLLASLRREDPGAFYRKADFHSLAVPLRALALAWDWLEPAMTAEQKAQALPALARWCCVAMEDTERQWWREASYNVGAIPVSGIGLLSLAIGGDTTHAAVATCHREAFRRISQNYLPKTWKRSGICYEGPCYAIVGLKYASLFSQAEARAGGNDLLATSGALHAMPYLMHQYMPWGGCAPIGDNTDYGRRTFAAEYLLGLGRTRDAEGLWTWRKYLRAEALDPLITYLWYPLDLPPANPAATRLPTSRYFEVTPNRAGYVFGRTAWDDRDAAFFAFVTRFENCNHQHYDMDSFLFGGYGTLFATHRLLYPYASDRHGVDYEHNLVIVDGGGWPRTNRTPSCHDDNSTDGVLVGDALSAFADYVRGDAKWSYRDNSIAIDNPAIRAERTCLFVKQTSAPYLLILDDVQQLGTPLKYTWLWHAPRLEMRGLATLAEPLVLATTNRASCAIQFVQPTAPALSIEVAQKEKDQGRLEDSPLVRIRVEQTGVRVRYAAIASVQTNVEQRPRVTAQAVACGNPSAGAACVRSADGAQDLIAWQSEEDHVQCGDELRAGALHTDGLLALVRVQGGNITGFVLGEGTYLDWGGTDLVRASSPVSVSAGAGDRQITGRRRSRENQPPEMPASVQVAPLPVQL